MLGAENHCTEQCVTGMHRDGTYQSTCCLVSNHEEGLLAGTSIDLHFPSFHLVSRCSADPYPSWDGSGHCLPHPLRWCHGLHISENDGSCTWKMVCHRGQCRWPGAPSNPVREGDASKGPCHRWWTYRKGFLLHADGRRHLLGLHPGQIGRESHRQDPRRR